MRAEGRREGGSGSILAVGLMASVVALLLLLAPVIRLSVLRAELGATADAAALAAADAQRGVIPGEPCALARRVAQSNGAALSGCAAEGGSATVEVSIRWLGATVRAEARAGAP